MNETLANIMDLQEQIKALTERVDELSKKFETLLGQAQDYI